MNPTRELNRSWRSAQETAAELGIALNTTYVLLAQGAIPGVKVGRQWRVSREALDAFLAGK